MPRDYSRSGCERCRLKKRKCGEERPACYTCVKFKTSCLYRSHTSASNQASLALAEVPVDVPVTSADSSLTNIPACNDETEGNVLRDIPNTIKGFFSPTSGTHARNLQVMWQLMASNDLLRNAGVACFSTVLGGSGALARVNQETYGRTLRSLRSMVLCDGLDQEGIICVVASIVFLGKMESFGPHSSADTLEHWQALIPLLENPRFRDILQRTTLPKSETMLIFESLLYNTSTHAMFSCITERVWKSWQACGIYRLICSLNPTGPDRISVSPLLCGRYLLYQMTFQITHLLQSHRDGHISSGLADEMEASIRRQDEQLDYDFAVARSSVQDTAKHDAECNIYHLFCNSLLICVTALRAPSPSQQQNMQQLVTLGYNMFLNLPIRGDSPQLAQHAGHFMLAAIWPIQILGCAMYDTASHQDFMHHLLPLQPYLDAGHRARALCLFDRVAQILEAAEDTTTTSEGENRAMPVGLDVLRRVGDIWQPCRLPPLTQIRSR